MSYLISIDPHQTEPMGVAIFIGSPPKLVDLCRWTLPVLLNFSLPRFAFPDRHAVIEKPYVGKNPAKSIDLAITCGRIKQVFCQQGFEVHWAYAWGENAWTIKAFGRSKKVPKREVAKRLSLAKAKHEWPKFKQLIDSHTADAACMGAWWLDNRKLERKWKRE